MDNLIIPYLAAANEHEREKRLDELLMVYAAPIVRRTLRRRLSFYVSAQGANPNNHQAEDLFQETMTKVVQMLHDLPSSQTKNEIENFEQYVGRVATNVCIDFLRTRTPARTRLKDSLRDLFRRHKELVSWEYEGEILCGFAVWRNTGKTFFSEQQSSEVEARMAAFQTARFPHEDIKRAPLTQVVAELFDWIGGPVEIDSLVRMMAIAMDIRERPIESLDDEIEQRWEARFKVSATTTDSSFRAKELLTRLWQAVKKLPREQREAFCLSFEDDLGQDLFTLLLSNGVVSLPQLAEPLERSVEEIILLSERMPMDGATVAAELNASRDNVYKWRFRAIQRLRTELT